MKKIILILLIFLLLAGLISAAFIYYQTRQNKAVENVNYSANSEEVVIGSSLSLSGFASFLGTEYLKGGTAYFNKINDEGGIFRRKIRLIAYDDQYNPTKTVANTQKLINQDKVFTLFNFVGTPTAIKVIPMLEEAGVPLVGLFTGAEIFRNPIRPHIFNIRPSYHQETSVFIKGAVEELKLEKIAVIYQYDAYGFDGLKGAEIALEKYNLKPVVAVNYERGTVNVENAVKAIEDSGAQAVVMVGTYSPMAKFIKLARADNFSPIFYSVSFVGPEALAQELGGEGDGVIVTQVVPPPDADSSFPAAKDYLSQLNKYYPGADPSFEGLEGFINAQILVEALKRAGPDLNHNNFMAALESIKDYAPGIDSVVNLSAANHAGMDKVYLTFIKEGKFVLFNDWREYEQSNLRENETAPQ